MPNVYLIKSNLLVGPFSPDEVNDLVQKKEIRITQLAWMKGMGNWMELSEKKFLKLGIKTSGENTSQSVEESIIKKTTIEIDESNSYGRVLKKGIGCYQIFGVIFISCCLIAIPVFGWIFLLGGISFFISKATKKSIPK